MTWNDNWRASARCKDDPERMFVTGAQQHGAKKQCMGCPVRAECLADALDSKHEWGVWGGMTERERRSVLRSRPNVASWRRLIEVARDGDAAVVDEDAPISRVIAAAIA